jgi:hypothetical protein
MKPRLAHVLRGAEYKFFFRAPKNRKHLGTCDIDSKEIEIKPGLSEADCLDCFIHEALHACMPDITDEAIDETATSIAKLLIKLGYRKEQ